MRIGIDLLWVKPQKSGGIESYIRNLLNGFLKYEDDKYEFILFTSINNNETFLPYLKSKKFSNILCNVDSSRVGKRIIWENLHLNHKCKENNIDILFVPVYSKPLINDAAIKYVTTIHDLQAMHYPMYFSWKKRMWLKFAWKKSSKTSDRIIAISNFVKNDIIDKFQIEEEKIKVIYNPIVKTVQTLGSNYIEEKYGLKAGSYFYTVAQLLPHKNIKTLLYVMSEIKSSHIDLPNKLVISGVGGKDKEELKSIIKTLNIEENIIITGFVSDEERDLLYENAKMFLFPSIFEGFGMPPIEAMELGTTVITTRCSCIPEVTEERAYYVEDPYDVNDWIENIMKAMKDKNKIKVTFPNYYLENITKEYLKCFTEVYES
ncbi:MAG: glycosyltransferase family 1 protein [Clostridium sp.]